MTAGMRVFMAKVSNARRAHREERSHNNRPLSSREALETEIVIVVNRRVELTNKCSTSKLTLRGRTWVWN